MADEAATPQEEGQKKGGSGFNIMGLLITVIVCAVVAAGVSFVMIQMLGTNNPPDSEQDTVATNPVEIRVRFIVSGSNTPFILKGGSEVVVIDMVSFTVGSDACREEIANRSDEITSAFQDLFIQKEPAELSTPAGLELLNRQIREMVNRITGYVGDKGRFGVIEVFYHITALTSVQ
ncbi:MAG TPA: flagellar basal body protein FliL [Thermotogota bacterium]|nr:flagellar basal body protein FliL [Thermotogota bacterium]HPJ89788.1 flagellar basal body protein FliL [Thermotogota bacterium]HPR95730.1 flagellar basal body protein FliL [Thermotogota bacterium]